MYGIGVTVQVTVLEFIVVPFTAVLMTTLRDSERTSNGLPHLQYCRTSIAKSRTLMQLPERTPSKFTFSGPVCHCFLLLITSLESRNQDGLL